MIIQARECIKCSFIRIPEVKIVKKKGKFYKIFKCRMCNTNDIENYTPAMLWNGSKFVEEYPDESDFDEEGKD